MKTLITVCHRRKEPRMTPPTKDAALTERLRATKETRYRAKKDVVLEDLRESEAALMEWIANGDVRNPTYLTIARRINAAIRLITKSKLDNGA